MQFTLGDLWHHMGPFARIIVAVMGVMSFASLYVMGERLVFFFRSSAESRIFAARVAQLVHGDGGIATSAQCDRCVLREEAPVNINPQLRCLLDAQLAIGRPQDDLRSLDKSLSLGPRAREPLDDRPLLRRQFDPRGHEPEIAPLPDHQTPRRQAVNSSVGVY